VANPGEESYYAIRHVRTQWEKKQGKPDRDFAPTERSNALYYYNRAKRFGDEELAAKWMEEYFAAGGTPAKLQRDRKARAPLTGMNFKDRMAFLKTLTETERKLLTLATEWHQNRPQAEKEDPAAGQADDE
jgi:hypothetical protein